MEHDPSRGEAPGRPVDERGYLASQPPERKVEGALEEIRRRLPNLRFSQGYVPEFNQNFFWRGPKELPLVWDVA